MAEGGREGGREDMRGREAAKKEEEEEGRRGIVPKTGAKTDRRRLISHLVTSCLSRLTCNYASISISPSRTALPAMAGAPEGALAWHGGAQEKVGKTL